MKLSSFLPKFGAANKKRDYFFALNISKKSVGAAVWYAKGDDVEIIGLATHAHHGGWEETISAADTALSTSCASLSFGNEIESVVFGLPSSYTEGDRIVSQHLGELKRLCRELSLKALGFVVLPEAINYYAGKKDGTPQSAILVGVDEETLTINLFKVGKSMGTVSIARTDSALNDVLGGLQEFQNIEVLPSKIILYGDGGLGQIRDLLLDYPWQTKSAFLHFPKIELLKLEYTTEAVASAGASELTKKSLPSESLIDKEETLPQKQSIGVAPLVTETNQPEVSTTTTAPPFGFVKDEDIALTSTPTPKYADDLKPLEHKEKKPNFFPKLHFPFRLTQFRLPHLPSYGLRISVIIASLLLVLVGGIAISLYWTVPTAIVKILVDPKTVSRTIDIKLDTSISSLDETNNSIPGETIEVEVSGQKSAGTTGKKIVGDPAKGEATIYNKTSNEKIFPKNTILIGPKNLQFTLDSEVNVASVSDIIVGTPGKARVKVTASSIGIEGNLPASSDFSFKDLPVNLYAARNEQAFSGGTSREIQVVSKNDQESIVKTLVQELDKNILPELTAKLSADKEFLPESLQKTVTKKVFSQEVGSEATQFETQVSVKAKATSFRKEDIITLARKNIANLVPYNATLSAEKPKIDVSDTKVSRDGSVTFSASIKAHVLPVIAKDDIKKSLIGKKFNDVEAILRKTAGVVGYEIIFTKELPFAKKNLPKLAQNLQVEVQPR